VTRTDCIFCKIISGNLPATQIYETPRVMAFLDVLPVQLGHTLVVSKSHYDNLLDLPDDLFLEMGQVGRKVAQAFQEVLRAQGFNLVMNNYEVAGQTVFHTHIHVIPRFADDGMRIIPQEKKKYEPDGMVQMGRRLAETLISLGDG
jgi:histidine triad (HIT) family protein